MSWRDRIFFAIPVPETVSLMVLGFLILASPILLPLLLLFMLGRALFKWRPWFAWCYTALTWSSWSGVRLGFSNGTTH